MTLNLCLLGGIEITLDGRRLDPGPARQQSVLAALLATPNITVSIDQIIERVWTQHPPPRVRNSLYAYINRLRGLLTVDGEVGIVRRCDGYMLIIDEQAVDLNRFRGLVTDARHADDDAEAARLLGKALRLWRGAAFAGLDTPWVHDIRSALDLEWVAAVLDYADRQLRLGQHADVLFLLATEADRRPLDERLAEQLMVALYRSGRQADALRHYELIRSRLADELGVDPRPALRQLHQRILVTDPTLTEPGRQRPPVPRQLPAPPWPFTGRTGELADLTAAMAPRGGPTVCTIGGAGGVGKTWLALHWAHQHANQFPDGQLYVNLRGNGPGSTSAVRDLLTALDVAATAIPDGLDAQVGLYRSLVTDKRMLIVVDNAPDTGQVVPLLPGSPSCAALITSRDRLTGLVSGHGAHPVWLDVLAEPEAHALLAARLGARRLGAEPDATLELLRCCAGLPLALSIVAGRALTHPEFPLSVLADELRDASTRLGVFDDDPTVGVRTVLSWSTATLSARQVTVFGLLGLAPGPDIGVPATAALTGLPIDQAHGVLRTLHRVSVLQEPVAGRYRMHDLVRLYAAERAMADRSAAERDAALGRLIDFTVRTALHASQVVQPYRPPPHVDPARPAGPRQNLADPAAVMAWFAAERANLLATQDMAARHHRFDAVWLLAWALVPFHRRLGCLPDDLDVWRQAVDTAAHLGAHALAYAHRSLASALSRNGEHTEALAHLDQAQKLAQRTGDLITQGHTRYLLAVTWGRLGEHAIALDHAIEGLRLFEALDVPVSRAHALNQVGWISACLGSYERARRSCSAALALFRDEHDQGGQANTLDSLGYIANETGNGNDAIDYYEQAIDLYRNVGDEYSEATALDGLASTYAVLGSNQQARIRWHRALRLYETHRRTEDARRVLDRLAVLGEPSRTW